MGGIARIDGVSYMFMSNPSIILTVPNGNQGSPSTVQGFEQALQQTRLEVTPTRSRFTLEGGGVQVVLDDAVRRLAGHARLLPQRPARRAAPG